MNKSEARKPTTGLLHWYFVRNGATSFATDGATFILADVSGSCIASLMISKGFCLCVRELLQLRCFNVLCHFRSNVPCPFQHYPVFHPSCLTELQRHGPILCSNSFIIITPCWSVLQQMMQCFEQAVYSPISCFHSFLKCIVNYMQATASKVDQWKAKIVSKTGFKFWIELRPIYVRSIHGCYLQQLGLWELICALLKTFLQVYCSCMSKKLGVEISWYYWISFPQTNIKVTLLCLSFDI